MKRIIYSLLIIVTLFGSSCSVTKYLEPGENLYAGASVRLNHPDTVATGDLQAQLATVANTSTNARLLGFPYKVWFYLKFQTDKEKGLKHWLSTNFGEEPIYYDDAVTRQVEQLLINRAENLGFFRAMAMGEPTINESKHSATVDYTVTVGRPYIIDTLYRELQDSSVQAIVDSVAANSLIQEGDRYNLFVLESERVRLQDALRSQGYYYFTANDLEYFADTLSDHRVKLLLTLKDGLARRKKGPQYISTVDIFSNYRLNTAVAEQKGDTLVYDGLRIICDDCPLRPGALAEGFAIRPGQTYSPAAHRRTLQRLSNFNTFKYISLSYDTVPRRDSLLSLTAYLTPRLRRTVEGEVGIVFNSGNYFGPEIKLSYFNRNLFRGAEFLRIDANYAYNFYMGGGDSSFPSFGSYGLRGTVNVPRLWLPNHERYFPNLMKGNTRFSAGYDVEEIPFLLNDPRFNYLSLIESLNLSELQQEISADSSYAPRIGLSNFLLQYGYNWQQQVQILHETNPITIRFQNVTAETNEVIVLLRESAKQQFGTSSNVLRLERFLPILSPDYIFLLDTRLKELNVHNFFLRQRFSYNYARVNPIETGIADPQPENSQFVQNETDLRYYLLFNARTSIATRLRAFVGYPLSQRAIIPYFDLYNVGGPNSLRAFPPRGVGPGRIPHDRNRFSPFIGYGNVLLETNVELRQRFAPLFELALFTDIGNVWEYRTQDPPLETDFSFSRVLDEVAIAGGIGLRVDLNFLLLRLDFAWPLQTPYPKTEDDNLNIVLAFGHPF